MTSARDPLDSDIYIAASALQGLRTLPALGGNGVRKKDYTMRRKVWDTARYRLALLETHPSRRPMRAFSPPVTNRVERKDLHNQQTIIRQVGFPPKEQPLDEAVVPLHAWPAAMRKFITPCVMDSPEANLWLMATGHEGASAWSRQAQGSQQTPTLVYHIFKGTRPHRFAVGLREMDLLRRFQRRIETPETTE